MLQNIDLRYIGNHIEVYSNAGIFLFSADSMREAMQELDGN